MENEYGFCGDNKDYLQHLVATARTHLGNDIILYTTDPPGVINRGTLAGGEVYRYAAARPAGCVCLLVSGAVYWAFSAYFLHVLVVDARQHGGVQGEYIFKSG